MKFNNLNELEKRCAALISKILSNYSLGSQFRAVVAFKELKEKPLESLLGDDGTLVDLFDDLSQLQKVKLVDKDTDRYNKLMADLSNDIYTSSKYCMLNYMYSLAGYDINQDIDIPEDLVNLIEELKLEIKSNSDVVVEMLDSIAFYIKIDTIAK